MPRWRVAASLERDGEQLWGDEVDVTAPDVAEALEVVDDGEMMHSPLDKAEAYSADRLTIEIRKLGA